jgi:hypothetical protein
MNSNAFLACPSKYDGKFGFTPSTSSRKYCHSAHHCHCFYLLVGDFIPDDGRIGKFSPQISPAILHVNYQSRHAVRANHFLPSPQTEMELVEARVATDAF